MKEKENIAEINIKYKQVDEETRNVKMEMNFDCELWEIIYVLSFCLVKACYKYNYPFKKACKSLKILEKHLRKGDK